MSPTRHRPCRRHGTVLAPQMPCRCRVGKTLCRHAGAVSLTMGAVHHAVSCRPCLSSAQSTNSGLLDTSFAMSCALGLLRTEREVYFRGSTGQFPPICFRNKKKIRSEFHVTYCSDSSESESLFLPPPPQWWCTLPPTLARFIPPAGGGIYTSLNVRACRLPRGVL